MKVYGIGKIFPYTVNQWLGVLIKIIFISSDIKTNVSLGEFP